MPLKLRIAILGVTAALGLAGPLQAACTLSASPLNFGAINPLQGGATQSTATVSVRCDTDTAYTLALSSGAGSYTERTMESGPHRLAYNLYRDSSRIEVWGDGTGGSFLVSGASNGAEQSHTVYGSVPYQPLAVSGSYADSITITLAF